MSHEWMRFLLSSGIVLIIWIIIMLIVWKSKKSVAAWAGLFGILGFLFVYFALLPLPAVDRQWGPEPFSQYYLRDIFTRGIHIWFWGIGGILIVYKGITRPLVQMREKTPHKAFASLIIGWGAGLPIAFCYWLTH